MKTEKQFPGGSGLSRCVARRSVSGHHPSLFGAPAWWIVMASCLAWGYSTTTLRATQATLAWDTPVQTTDGTVAPDISGYHLYYGTASKSYSFVVDAGPASTLTLTNLQDGTPYYFTVSAYNSIGLEGDYAQELVWTPVDLHPLDHFVWAPISSPQTAGQPIAVTVTAQDPSNLTASSFTGSASLSLNASKRIPIGTGTGSSIYPLATSSDDARTQVIYLANDIGFAGWINALALDIKTQPGQALNNWTLRLKPTTLGSFSTKSTWESSGWSLVHQSRQEISATGLVYFTFATPFYYNGTSNLLIDFSFNNTNHSKDGYTRYTSTSSKRTMYYKANGTYGDPLTWSKTTPRFALSASIPNIQLQFSGPVTTLTPTQTTSFASGVWTGNITVTDPAIEVILSASDINGHTGKSSPFVVKDAAASTLQSISTSLGAAPSATPSEGDFDGDGMSDPLELIAGTDPYNPESTLQINSLDRPTEQNDTGYTIQWASVTGKTYSVLRSTNLLVYPAFTSIATNIPGQDGTTRYTDTRTPLGVPCFYQIQVEP